MPYFLNGGILMLFRHMMGNLMSDCQELVYKGFVPVPEDLEELGDNSPLAR